MPLIMEKVAEANQYGIPKRDANTGRSNISYIVKMSCTCNKTDVCAADWNYSCNQDCVGTIGFKALTGAVNTLCGFWKFTFDGIQDAASANPANEITDACSD